jgi:hypothetical protein
MTDQRYSYQLDIKKTSSEYRCDDFKKDHSGKHILFIGDSFASGEGLEKEDTWCYKVYNKIKEKENVSGYYNIGMVGTSITESIDQFFKYMPDVVFFIITEPFRDAVYAKKESVIEFIKKSYMHLEQYCRSHLTQLYSFTWLKSFDLPIKKPKRYLFKDRNNNLMVRPLWTEQIDQQKVMFNLDFLNQFKTFYDYDGEVMAKEVYKYDKQSNNPSRSLWAEDDSHPGTSFHNFYADFIYSKYLENNK